MKKYEKHLLENYIFCFHDKFKKSIFLNELKFTKGLDYFLSGNKENQEEIKNFVEHCISCENKDGYLSYWKDIINIWIPSACWRGLHAQGKLKTSGRPIFG